MPSCLAVRMSHAEGTEGVRQHRFLYIDPNAIAWRWPTETSRHWVGPGLMATYEDVLKGFVGEAMTAQLMDTLEAEPEVRERLDVPLRHSLLASGQRGLATRQCGGAFADLRVGRCRAVNVS